MADELIKARQAIVDAEREVRFDPDKARAFVEIAHAYIRIEELKVQKQFLQAFKEKRFD